MLDTPHDPPQQPPPSSTRLPPPHNLPNLVPDIVSSSTTKPNTPHSPSSQPSSPSHNIPAKSLIFSAANYAPPSSLDLQSKCGTAVADPSQPAAPPRRKKRATNSVSTPDKDSPQEQLVAQIGKLFFSSVTRDVQAFYSDGVKFVVSKLEGGKPSFTPTLGRL